MFLIRQLHCLSLLSLYQCLHISVHTLAIFHHVSTKYQCEKFIQSSINSPHNISQSDSSTAAPPPFYFMFRLCQRLLPAYSFTWLWLCLFCSPSYSLSPTNTHYFFQHIIHVSKDMRTHLVPLIVPITAACWIIERILFLQQWLYLTTFQLWQIHLHSSLWGCVLLWWRGW